MLRRLVLAAGLLLLPAVAAAAQPRCPLPLDTCIVRFGRTRERPWLGVGLHADSLGRRIVDQVLPGSPAEAAGMKAGDVLRTIDSRPPQEFFLAGRAGWKSGDRIPVEVLRAGRVATLSVAAAPIPEDVLARIVGEHMLEGHLAYMEPAPPHDVH